MPILLFARLVHSCVEGPVAGVFEQGVFTCVVVVVALKLYWNTLHYNCFHFLVDTCSQDRLEGGSPTPSADHLSGADLSKAYENRRGWTFLANVCCLVLLTYDCSCLCIVDC